MARERECSGTRWLRVAVAVAVGLWAVGCGGRAAWAAYAANPLFGDVSVTDPDDDDEVWLAGSDHAVTCSTVTDYDCDLETGDPVEDSVTHWWKSPDGTFKQNEYVGTSVTYICSNSALGGTDKINAYADDHCSEVGHEDSALADDYPGEESYPAKKDDHDVTVVVPWCEQLDFCGTKNYDIYDNTATPAAKIGLEFDRSEDKNEPACQQMGDQVTLANVRFRHDTALTEGSTVMVGTTAVSTITFPWNTASWPYWDTLALSTTSTNDDDGKLIDEVHKYDLETDSEVELYWQYRVPTGSNVPIECTDNPTSHTVYTVVSAPTAPMHEGKDGVWLGVLEKSCAWASGQTTANAAAQKVVESIYASGFAYNNVTGGASFLKANGAFDLTACLSAWGTGVVNCWDCACMVCVFTNALGGNLQLYEMRKSGGTFLVNYIKPIGRSWTNDTCPGMAGRQGFLCHWVAWYNVYDACLQVDDDADPTTAPPQTGLLPVNMTFNAGTEDPYDDYRGKLVDPGDESSVTGSTKGRPDVE